MSSSHSRAEQGAIFLDNRAAHWEECVDTNLLKMESCFHCILGQLYGTYSKGIKALGLDLIDEKQLGFTTDMNDWIELDCHWVQLILDRRAHNEPTEQQLEAARTNEPIISVDERADTAKRNKP